MASVGALPGLQLPLQKDTHLPKDYIMSFGLKYIANL